MNLIPPMRKKTPKHIVNLAICAVFLYSNQGCQSSTPAPPAPATSPPVAPTTSPPVAPTTSLPAAPPPAPTTSPPPKPPPATSTTGYSPAPKPLAEDSNLNDGVLLMIPARKLEMKDNTLSITYKIALGQYLQEGAFTIEENFLSTPLEVSSQDQEALEKLDRIFFDLQMTVITEGKQTQWTASLKELPPIRNKKIEIPSCALQPVHWDGQQDLGTCNFKITSTNK